MNGEVGLKSYCEEQSVLIDRMGTRSEFIWYPYSSRKLKRLGRLLRIFWGTPLGRWLS